MRINHNLSALNTYRQLTANTSSTGKSLEKLSSGLRINKAGDDAAGLAISEKMRGQIRGLDQASRNASDGISLIQTAEGGLNETHSILQRMRELAVQSSNGTLQDTDRAHITAEVQQMESEITRISTDTKFNSKSLIASGATFSDTFHVGADAGQTISLTLTAADATTLAVNDIHTSVGTSTAASAAITTIDSAINTVSTLRATLGSVQNRLEHTITNLSATSENLTASESRIRDVDMAKEMMEFTKNNILSQASQAMLAQANQQPQSVLQLLQ